MVIDRRFAQLGKGAIIEAGGVADISMNAVNSRDFRYF